MLSFFNGIDMFNQHINKDAIKNTLAVLMIEVVNADKKVTSQERKKILDFFKLEFDMDENTTIDFFNLVKENDTEFNASLAELKSILVDDINARAKTLQHLNSVIICDGCVDEEYEVFESIRGFLL